MWWHTFNPNTQEEKISVSFRLARAIVSSYLKTKQTKIHNTFKHNEIRQNSCRTSGAESNKWVTAMTPVCPACPGCISTRGCREGTHGTLSTPGVHVLRDPASKGGGGWGGWVVAHVGILYCTETQLCASPGWQEESQWQPGKHSLLTEGGYRAGTRHSTSFTEQLPQWMAR